MSLFCKVNYALIDRLTKSFELLAGEMKAELEAGVDPESAEIAAKQEVLQEIALAIETLSALTNKYCP